MEYPLKQEVFDDIKKECIFIYEEKNGNKTNEYLVRLMNIEGIPMHCPYHHFIVPATFLLSIAIDEDVKKEDFIEWLNLAEERAKTIPAGFCGECGACGAAIGLGIFISVYTKATPVTKENWSWANEGTGIVLQKIAEYSGPRCCKRTSFITIQEGTKFVNQVLEKNIKVDQEIECTYFNNNPSCLKEECPFFK